MLQGSKPLFVQGQPGKSYNFSFKELIENPSMKVHYNTKLNAFLCSAHIYTVIHFLVSIHAVLPELIRALHSTKLVIR